MLMFKDFKCLC